MIKKGISKNSVRDSKALERLQKGGKRRGPVQYGCLLGVTAILSVIVIFFLFPGILSNLIVKRPVSRSAAVSNEAYCFYSVSVDYFEEVGPVSIPAEGPPGFELDQRIIITGGPMIIEDDYIKFESPLIFRYKNSSTACLLHYNGSVEQITAISSGAEDETSEDQKVVLEILYSLINGVRLAGLKIRENSEEVDFLIVTLATDDRDWVRRKTAKFLGDIKVAQTAEALIDSIRHDASFRVLDAARDALLKINGSIAAQPLVDIVLDKDAGVANREIAIGALGQIKDPISAAPLITVLDDSEYRLRNAAAKALAEIKDTSAIEPLIVLLRHQDADRRKDAAEALGQLKDPRAVEPLIATLKDNIPWVRKSAAMALGYIGDPRSCVPLSYAMYDNNADVRLAAARALGKMDNAQVSEILIAALKEERWWVREKAAFVLGESKNSRALEPLIMATTDERPEVRRKVVEALGRLEDASACDVLIRALDDVDPYVPRLAARALGKIGSPEAVEFLIPMLDHQERGTQNAAKSALSMITRVPNSRYFDPTDWKKWWQQNKHVYVAKKRPMDRTKEKRTAPKTLPEKQAISIVGSWTYSAPGSACLEEYTFYLDGTLKIKSHQEVQEGIYTIDETVPFGERHRLSATIIADNGLPDCSGRINDLTGRPAAYYVEFSAKGKAFVLFKEPKGAEFLIGPFNKIQ